MKEEHFITILDLLAQHHGNVIREVSKRLNDEIMEGIIGARHAAHFQLEAVDEDSFGPDSYDSDTLMRLCERM